MKATVLARRYAKALFELALERKILETVAKEVVLFNALIEENPQLHYYFRSPEAGKSGKKKLVEKNFQDRFSALFVNFIFVLLDKGRQHLFGDIAAEFKKLCEKHDNLVRARTITAIPLSPSHITKLKQALSERYQARFDIENYVDPGILGGMILNIDGKVIDASIRTQLERMKASMSFARN